MNRETLMLNEQLGLERLQKEVDPISLEIFDLIQKRDTIKYSNSVDEKTKDSAIRAVERQIDALKEKQQDYFHLITQQENRIKSMDKYNKVTKEREEAKLWEQREREEAEFLEQREKEIVVKQFMSDHIEVMRVYNTLKNKERANKDPLDIIFDYYKDDIIENIKNKSYDSLILEERNFIAQELGLQSLTEDEFNKFKGVQQDTTSSEQAPESTAGGEDKPNDLNNNKSYGAPVSNVKPEQESLKSNSDVNTNENQHDKVINDLAAMGLVQSEGEDNSIVPDGSVVDFDVYGDDEDEKDLNGNSLSDMDKIKSHIPDNVLQQSEPTPEPIEYTQVLDPDYIEKSGNSDNPIQPPLNLEQEAPEKVSMIAKVTETIKNVLDGPKAPAAVAALVLLGGAAVVATGPIGFTAVGTAISGVGSAGLTAGLGAAAYEVKKGKGL